MKYACYARVTFYRDCDGSPMVYTDFDIIIPPQLDLVSALLFAEGTARYLLAKEEDYDPNIEIVDCMVSFKRSHQSAEDPSVLP